MDEKAKKELKVYSIFLAVFLILCILTATFAYVIVNSPEKKKDDKISAKEAFVYLSNFDRYEKYLNNITEISASGGLSTHGRAEMWKFRFRDEYNETADYFAVTVHKNLTHLHIEDPGIAFIDPFFKNWKIDSTEAMEIAMEDKRVKDFFSDYGYVGVGLGGLSIESSWRYPSRDCVVKVAYGAGGGLIMTNYDLDVYIDGTTGEIIEVVDERRN
jgi:hypothetical protein